MAKLIWHTTMSLDGFIAGPDHAMEWVFEYPEGPGDTTVADVIRATGAILAGRNSYDVGEREGQVAEATEPFGGAWSGPQFVLTHHPPAESPDPSITFLEGDIDAAADTALAAAGGRNVLVFGANTARQCLEAGRLDEVLVHIAPVLLGEGVRLYGDPPAPRVELERIGVGAPGENVTILRFSVGRRL